VAILQDLSGPKIRTGDFPRGGFVAETGSTVQVVEGSKADPGVIPIEYPGLASDLAPGDRILLDDGRVGLSVLAVSNGAVECRVETGGTLRDGAGVHFPRKALALATLTDKDKDDLAFGLSEGIDYLALSFVRSPDDVREARALVRASGRIVPVIAKIERPEAVARIEEIAREADGLMVARGDLGVEFPPEEVPVIQRRILGVAARAMRPTIIATEMLQSMVRAPRPTRAESSDVATAVFDGADAVMLSGETATGVYPVESVRMMDKIVRAAEESAISDAPPPGLPDHAVPTEEAIARAACVLARATGATLVCVFTLSGTTARLVSMSRPPVPVIGFSPDEGARRRLMLYRSVTPEVLAPARDMDEMVSLVEARLVALGLVAKGDRVVVVFGAPIGVPGQTNALRVHEILASGPESG
jgi:pyruvate kinase